MTWFGRAKGKTATAALGERIYAIGDIHGSLTHLRDLLDRIDEHASALPPARAPRLIVLGDMIDRGPDSFDVLAYLHRVQQRSARVTILAGNHEDLLLRVLRREISTQRLWLEQGGLATLKSFGVPAPLPGEHPWLLADRLAAAIPPDLLAWLEQLPLTTQSGDYLFCHAGMRPGVRLKRQSRGDLLWIREPFLTDDSDHGFVVVHGHSRSFEPDIRDNRIGIDTGAYCTGRLTALYLEGTAREILMTDGLASI